MKTDRALCRMGFVSLQEKTLAEVHGQPEQKQGHAGKVEPDSGSRRTLNSIKVRGIMDIL
jgi:hypothetical protein